MIVRASIRSDYIFIPEARELAQFYALWGGKAKPSGDGFTLIGYDVVPEYAIKGVATAGGVTLAPVTRSFETKAELMTSARVAISPSTGEILDAVAGISAAGGRIGRTAIGYEADHLPAILGLYPIAQQPDRICIAINGNFDLNTGKFSGILDFLSLGELWSE